MVKSFKNFIELLSNVISMPSTNADKQQGNSASTGVVSNPASKGAESNPASKGAESNPASKGEVGNQKLTAVQMLNALKAKRSAGAAGAAADSPNTAAVETEAQKQFRERQEKLVNDATKSIQELNEAIAASNSRTAAAQAAAAAAQAETDAATAAAAAKQAVIDAEEAKLLSDGTRIMHHLAKHLQNAIREERKADTILTDEEFKEGPHKDWSDKRTTLSDQKRKFKDSIPTQFHAATYFEPALNQLKNLTKSTDPKTKASAEKTLMLVTEYRKILTEYGEMEEALPEPLNPRMELYRRVVSFLNRTGIQQLLNHMLNGDGLTALQCFHNGICPMLFSFLKNGSDTSGNFFFSFNIASQNVVLDLHWKRMFRPYNKEFDSMNLGQEGYYVYSLQLAIYNFLTTVVPAVAHKRQAPIWKVLMNHCYIADLSEIAKVDLCHSEVLLHEAKMKERGPKEVVSPKGDFLTREDVARFLLSSDQSKIIEQGIPDSKADWTNPTSPVAPLAEFMRESGFKSFETSIECLKELGVIPEESTNIPSEKNPERMAYTVLTELKVQERFSHSHVIANASAPAPAHAQKVPSLKEESANALQKLLARKKEENEKKRRDEEEKAAAAAAEKNRELKVLEQEVEENRPIRRADIQAKVDAARARLAQEKASCGIASASDALPQKSVVPAASALNAANDKLFQVLQARLKKAAEMPTDDETGSNALEFLRNLKHNLSKK